MGDYGIRISQEGHDVKTCDDKHCVLTSKYPVLKGFITGSGTKTVPHDDIKRTTIYHNLGYIPFVTMFIDENQTGDYILCPVYTVTGLSQSAYWCKAKSDRIELKFWQGNEDEDTIKVDYKYFIYLDKGKLS